ncbi:MCE family protein [Aldersonia sp. NBC_00410]|uniref:MCE family protein n=1 Tax=Aldersonia sp. NBC_00410 TaxID=2975954 RepID=UPI00225B547D|nr:MCE family protein [Aldersonia sp. NBC_00410]MCX5042986.1 MCE family protein [Aldersonia sp. NBC_00410]
MRTVAKPLIGFSLFAIISIVVTWVTWSTLQRNVEGDTQSYSATFSDVLGLHGGDDVRISGVRVGRVERIALDSNHNANVTFVVQDDQQLYSNTKALVRYQNLIGQRYLALAPGKGDATPLEAGGAIPLDHTEPSFDISGLLNGFEPLFSTLQPEQVNSLSNTLIQALQGDNVSLSAFITQAAGLAVTVQQRDVILGSVIDNLSGVLSGLANRSTELESLIAQTQFLVGGLYAQGQTLLNSTQRVAGATDAMADMIGQIQPQLQTTSDSTSTALNYLVGNGAALDQAAIDLPPVLTAIARISQNGAWANAYFCSLDVSLWGVLFPPGLFSQVGGNSHSEVCR